MEKSEIKEIILQVVDIAEEAGKAILEIYNSDDLGVESKSDESPLTKADTTANKIICDGLISINADIPIISEENKSIPYEERKDFTYYWMVDPLDGTKEFIKKNGEFTVNIALMHKHSPIASVVYAPVLDKMYYAVEGQKAFLRVNKTWEKLNANKFNLADNGLRVVCSRSHLNDATQSFINDLDQPVKVSKGSSLKFLILAEGGAEVYPRMAPTMEWDTAAAHIILLESGGQLYQPTDRSPLIYNKKDLTNPHFVALANEQPH